MQVLTGKIKYPAGKAFASKLEGKPARQSLKITLNRSNEDIDLWFDEGRQPHCSLKKGDEVTVIRNGDRYTLAVEEDEAPPPANANDTSAATTSATGKFPSWSDEHKRKIFQELCQRAAILKHCHVQMTQLFTHPDTGNLLVDSETLQKYATTLYLDIRELW